MKTWTETTGHTLRSKASHETTLAANDQTGGTTRAGTGDHGQRK
jgi:hypothetical protein